MGTQSGEQKAEDPIYVLEHNLPIDVKYYLENQLSKPLLRIFEPIMGEKKAGTLLSTSQPVARCRGHDRLNPAGGPYMACLAGEHTRTISIATPTIGALSKFTERRLKCIGCKTPLEANGKN